MEWQNSTRIRINGKTLAATRAFSEELHRLVEFRCHWRGNGSVYGGTSVFTVKNVVVSLMIGVVLIVGKRVVDWVSERAFILLIELAVVSGIYFLIAG